MQTPKTTPSATRSHAMALPAVPRAVGTARACLRSLLEDWHAAVDPDIAVLLASDVITYVITRGAAGDGAGHGSVRLVARQSPTDLRLEVHDCGIRECAFAHVDPGSPTEPGRCLELVDLLADERGSCKHGSDGKYVYFVLAVSNPRPVGAMNRAERLPGPGFLRRPRHRAAPVKRSTPCSRSARLPWG
jgi:hypothetical protein